MVEVVEPRDAAEQLAIDRTRAAGVAISLVQEDGVARRAVVGHLEKASDE